ncbi:hypothetical protein [Rivibacter subsaxonicus]|uniref:Outer membrane beta-barrel porin/alpha-amylase n=1 Tax=Rivibacter subsaxonicus TaxID=457575 RepID=A0A4Q7VWN9_9BURK|nr:hypothetical protein [Rivibacter subsaxonicus]RZU01141.1 hypothetical protein EV670_1857 [Rivibacter subsaxonicus]
MEPQQQQRQTTRSRPAAGLALLAAAALLAPPSASAQSADAELLNRSNNPLAPFAALNVQNQYSPYLHESSAEINDFFVRGLLPVAPNGLIGVPQVLGLTLPFSSRPAPGGGSTVGPGDLSLSDLFVLHAQGLQLGIGPMLTLPTASSDELGAGKWQAGVDAVALAVSPARLLGARLQWQRSFAGDGERQDVDAIALQPLAYFNFDRGWYLRSTAAWRFDLRNGDYVIPVGFGGGKAIKAGTSVLNFYMEPQWSVAHQGQALPRFTITAGLNLSVGN